jgi:small subunit ribosomal protein S21e
MQNDHGKCVDLYVPRKCSATNRVISSKDHSSVQLAVAQVDENGRFTGETYNIALAGFLRQKGNADAALNGLLHSKGAISFSS